MTRKPCPACKEIKPDRKADDICYDCQRNLQLARQVSIAYAETMKDKIVVAFGQRSHWNKYLPIPTPQTGNRELARNLQKVLHDLALAITSPTVDKWDRNAPHLLGDDSSPWQSQLCYRYCSPETLKAMQDLRAILDEIVTSAYEAGKEEGRKLLVGLAQGDLTIDQYQYEISRKKQ